MYSTYLGQDGVYYAEGARASNASAAVYHSGPLVRVHHATGPHCVQELKEHVRVLGNTKIRPLGVVEVLDIPRLLRLGKRNFCELKT